MGKTIQLNDERLFLVSSLHAALGIIREEFSYELADYIQHEMEYRINSAIGHAEELEQYVKTVLLPAAVREGDLEAVIEDYNAKVEDLYGI